MRLTAGSAGWFLTRTCDKKRETKTHEYFEGSSAAQQALKCGVLNEAVIVAINAPVRVNYSPKNLLRI